MNDLLSLVSALLVLVLVLLSAWGFSRFLGKRWNGMQAARYMRVVDQLVVGQDRLLLILRIDQEEDCFLVASSPEGIRILSRLSGEYEAKEEAERAMAFPLQGGFKEYFKSSLDALHEFKASRWGKEKDREKHE